MPEDVSTFFRPFYDPNKKCGELPGPGQIVFAPVPQTERAPYMAAAQRADQVQHGAADVTFRRLRDGDFRRTGRLPIAALHLGETEELLVAKAKQRPCIVIGASTGVPSKSLPKGPEANQAVNSFEPVYLLAPFYSVSRPDELSSFGPVLTARIKVLMYPEFVFAPQSGGIVSRDSIIRLDRSFWCHLVTCCSRENLFVSDAILNLILEQLNVLTGDTPSMEFTEVRQLLLEELPAGAVAGL